MVLPQTTLAATNTAATVNSTPAGDSTPFWAATKTAGAVAVGAGGSAVTMLVHLCFHHCL